MTSIKQINVQDEEAEDNVEDQLEVSTVLIMSIKAYEYITKQLIKLPKWCQ